MTTKHWHVPVFDGYHCDLFRPVSFSMIPCTLSWRGLGLDNRTFFLYTFSCLFAFQGKDLMLQCSVLCFPWQLYYIICMGWQVQDIWWQVRVYSFIVWNLLCHCMVLVTPCIGWVVTIGWVVWDLLDGQMFPSNDMCYSTFGRWDMYSCTVTPCGPPPVYFLVLVLYWGAY